MLYSIMPFRKQDKAKLNKRQSFYIIYIEYIKWHQREKLKQIKYENAVQHFYQTLYYDDEILVLLLELLKTDPPFRKVTFSLISQITCNMCYNNKLKESLKPEHYAMLIEGYEISINNLTNFSV